MVRAALGGVRVVSPGDPAALTRVGLVGGGRGGLALLDLLLDWPKAEVAVVIDPQPEAPARVKATAVGIPVGRHHLEVFAHDVQIVFEVTGQERVLDELLRAKPAGVEILGAQGLHFFWELLQDELRAGAHLAAVLEINKKIGSTAQTETLLTSIAEEAARLLDVDNAGFRLLEGDRLVLAGLAGTAPQTMLRRTLKIGESFSGRVFAEGRSLIANTESPGLIPEHRAADRQLGYTTYLGVPLKVGTRTIGVFAFRGRRPFTARDQASAEAFADQAAIALEHARLHRDAAHQAERMAALADLGRVLSETLDPDVVARQIPEPIRRLLGAHSAAVLRPGPGSGELVVLARATQDGVVSGLDITFPAGIGVAGLAVRAREPIVTSDLLADPRVILTPEVRAWIEEAGYRAVLAVPMIVKGQVIGVLSIGDQGGRTFTSEEIRLAQTFADQAALALENAGLYQRAQQAYEELSRTQAQLVRGETLRATGELAAGVAHHLNNLLAVVLGRLQLVLRNVAQPELHRQLEPAEMAAQDAAQVVARLTRFSRYYPETSRATANLNELAQEVVELTRPRWQNEAQARGLRIDIGLERGAIPRVAADPASIREVLVNLVLNAVDALPRGGRILIKTWLASEDVHCAVSDTGIGMSAEVQRRALEPFFTTKGLKSTGLGLSVNYGIIQRYGGELMLDSVEGRGTTVTFRLPMAGSLAQEAESPTTKTSPTPLRILLIDDEREVRTVMAAMLAEDGHDVAEAASGAEGLAQLEAGRRVDLVLTDLGMPEMTGWDVVRAIRAAYPWLRVGLLTGWGEAPPGEPDDRAGADFLLTKPVTQDKLRFALGQGRQFDRPGSSGAGQR